MSKTYAPSVTIDATIVALSALDMNQIRGGMATMDTEKAKRIRTGGIRDGGHAFGKDKDDDDKEEKVKKIKHC